MKKLMTLVLVCIMAFTCSFSAMAEPKDASQNNLVVDEEVASELARYFNARNSLLSTGDTRDLSDVLIDGIANDELKHYSGTRGTCYSNGFNITEIQVGEKEADVQVEESTLEGIVLHKIVLFRRLSGGWMVVSDGYFNTFDNFKSASYVDPEEAAILEAMRESQDGGKGTRTSGTVLRSTFLNVANNEVGYLEKASNSNLNSPTANPGNNNYTKYGAWFNNNPADWCAMFVSWCANQAGISNSIIPCSDTVQGHINGFTASGTYYAASSYTPASGDIFLMKIPGVVSHTGIVTAKVGSTIQVIDGNAKPAGATYDQVRTYTFAISDTRLTGYGHPCYCLGGNHSPSNSYSSDLYTHWHTCTLCGAHVDEAAHTWVNYGSYYKCSVCNKKATTVPGVNGFIGSETE